MARLNAPGMTQMDTDEAIPSVSNLCNLCNLWFQELGVFEED